MNRARRTLLGLALAAGATACAFWDLEDYSSVVDAGTDAGVDAPPIDAAKEAAGDAAVCVPSFSLAFPGLSIREALDPSTEVAYVAGGRDPDGGVGGTGPGYLAVVDACAGKITKAFDPPVANGKATWSLASPSLSGT